MHGNEAGCTVHDLLPGARAGVAHPVELVRSRVAMTVSGASRQAEHQHRLGGAGKCDGAQGRCVDAAILAGCINGPLTPAQSQIPEKAFVAPHWPDFLPTRAYKRPAAMLIASASKVALKKYASTQCTVPTPRNAPPLKETSAVWPDVPITQAK